MAIVTFITTTILAGPNFDDREGSLILLPGGRSLVNIRRNDVDDPPEAFLYTGERGWTPLTDHTAELLGDLSQALAAVEDSLHLRTAD